MVLLTGLGTSTLARIVMPEPIFCAFIAWAVYCGIRCLESERGRRWAFAMWLCAALATFSKGMHGLVYPLAILGVTALCISEWRRRTPQNQRVDSKSRRQQNDHREKSSQASSNLVAPCGSHYRRALRHRRGDGSGAGCRRSRWSGRNCARGRTRYRRRRNFSPRFRIALQAFQIASQIRCRLIAQRLPESRYASTCSHSPDTPNCCPT